MRPELRLLRVALIGLCVVTLADQSHANEYCFYVHNIRGTNITDLHINLLSPVTGIVNVQSPEGWTDRPGVDEGAMVIWETTGPGIPEGQEFGIFSFDIAANKVKFQWFVSRGPDGKWGRTHTEEWTKGRQECYVLADDETQVPTVSMWGLLVMGLLLLAGSKIYFARRRRQAAA